MFIRRIEGHAEVRLPRAQRLHDGWGDSGWGGAGPVCVCLCLCLSVCLSVGLPVCLSLSPSYTHTHVTTRARTLTPSTSSYYRTHKVACHSEICWAEGFDATASS